MGEKPMKMKLMLQTRTLCIMGGSPGDVSEGPVTKEKRKKDWSMCWDVGETTERWENGLWRR